MMKDVVSIIKNKGGDISANIEVIFLKHTVKYHIWGKEDANFPDDDELPREHRIKGKSFEYANFSDEELSRELNKYGRNYDPQFKITANEINGCRAENTNLDKFIRDKPDTYLKGLNKREFGEQIGNFIAKEIKERTNRPENQRPIEEVLNQIIGFTVENI